MTATITRSQKKPATPITIMPVITRSARDSVRPSMITEPSPVGTPVTSAVFGVPAERLGEVLSAGDPSYQAALRGKGLCGPPGQGLAERLVAERLQHDAPLRSVAMAPIIASGRLIALLELGRTEHVFRADDGAELAQFAAQVARRIG